MRKIAIGILLTSVLGVSAKAFPSVKTNVFIFKPLTAASGLVLTSDNNGNGSWQPIDSAWVKNTLGTYTEGNVGIGTTAVGSPLKVVGEITTDRLRVASNSSPSSTDSCKDGEITWDQDYVYVCTSLNNYKRSALTAY